MYWYLLVSSLTLRGPTLPYTKTDIRPQCGVNVVTNPPCTHKWPWLVGDVAKQCLNTTHFHCTLNESKSESRLAAGRPGSYDRHGPTSPLHRRVMSRNNNNSCVPRWPGFYLLPLFVMYLSVRRGQMGLCIPMRLDSFLGCISATLAVLSYFSSFFGNKSSYDVWKLGKNLILKLSTTLFFYWHYNELWVLAFSVILFHSALSSHSFLHRFLLLLRLLFLLLLFLFSSSSSSSSYSTTALSVWPWLPYGF